MERWYWAALQKVGALSANRLLKLVEYFGDAKQVWQAASAEWRAAGVTPELCAAFETARKNLTVEELAESMEKQGIRICLLTDDDYPALLRQICRPPLLFYYYGQLPLDDRLIAVVGTRKASQYGKNAATQIAAQLAAAGFCVVSGAARGIDAAAHRGALPDGRTVAVLGCAIDKSYPAEHRQLLRQIVDGGGAVLSEYPPGFPTYRANFPARNRIISGLSRGVVVVEAAEKSGALITSDFALEEGRDVFAVPGSIFSPLSSGTNRLLAQGAKVLRDAQDVLEEYGEIRQNQWREKSVYVLQEREAALYDILTYDDALAPEELIWKTGLSAAEVAHGLLLLELRGLIAEQDGKRYIRVAREGIR